MDAVAEQLLREGEHPELEPLGETPADAVSEPARNLVAVLNNSFVSREQQQLIVEQLRLSPNLVWSMDKFDAEGKGNYLLVTPAGQAFLNVIKQGIHFSRLVQLAGSISPTSISTLQRTLRTEFEKKQKEWEHNLPQGYLPEGITTHTAESEFDPNGGNRPGAVFVFDRSFNLGIFDAATGEEGEFHWVGKHTNPTETGGAFQVADTFTFEWKKIA